jgi:acyl carrier protein
MTDDALGHAVVEVVQRIWADTGRPVRDISPSDTFTGTLQLDSLDLAVLVVGLEQKLGIDPFRAGARPVQTVGELVELYRTALEDKERT